MTKNPNRSPTGSSGAGEEDKAQRDSASDSQAEERLALVAERTNRPIRVITSLDIFKLDEGEPEQLIRDQI